MYDPAEGTPKGNCWQTVIACYLDLDLEDVPHFVQIDEDGGLNWWYHTCSWLRERGYEILHWEEYPATNEYVLVSGRSPRGDFHHVVIYKDGKLFHDPHPSQAGVETEEEFDIIRPIKAMGDQPDN